jgi:hypothetical protein
VLKTKQPTPPSAQDALNPVAGIEFNSKVNTNNYSAVGSDFNQTSNQGQDKNKNDLLDSFGKFFDTAYKASVDLAYNVKDKVTDSDLGHKILEAKDNISHKILEAKDKTVDMLITTKDVVVHTGQEVGVNIFILITIAIRHS